MNHEVILFAQRHASLRGVEVLGEEGINIIDDDPLAGDLIALLVDVAGLEVWVRHLHILCTLHAFHDLLNESDFVLRFDPLEATDEVLIALPGLDLLQALEVEQPLIIISQYIGDQVRQQSIRALNPLTRIDSLRHVLESLR